MSRRPYDFETNIDVDVDEILSYVQENQEWFLNELGVQTVNESTKKYLEEILDKFDFIRRSRDYRDGKATKTEIELYEYIEAIKNSI
ncbi:MAG: hypothetical protein IJ880_11320 [Bacilli bacterium]|nr:hypothetical protein [Bacilli bacterium]